MEAIRHRSAAALRKQCLQIVRQCCLRETPAQFFQLAHRLGTPALSDQFTDAGDVPGDFALVGASG
ncbi:hypothetical protein B1808_14270 [Pseudofulvimonas gallinarii]|jgi:hypothetical protein|uniref:hypothetical protein n=1 Tax=Pseudofulvimonas gallinarii TaxID=634155 RepID=UPI000F4722E6|nr:hypothetical protein [Pseudofulvimonas gallinarii]THD11681.1 hypothetical protein B1808_14270 [Pseudofulvimonas gallinarii]